MRSRRDERLRNIHNQAGMVTSDGHWYGSPPSSQAPHRRVYGPDLMRKMTAVSQLRGYRQFYYGGAEGMADKLKQALIASHPRLEVAGTFSPTFRDLTSKEDQAVVDAINAAR